MEETTVSTSLFMDDFFDENNVSKDNKSILDLNNRVSMENFALIKVLGRGGKI